MSKRACAVQDWIILLEFRAEVSAGDVYERRSCPAVCKPRGGVMSPSRCMYERDEAQGPHPGAL